jgi:hypothetical protein
LLRGADLFSNNSVYAGNLKFLEGSEKHECNGEPVFVPEVGIRCPMLFAPVKKFFNDYYDKPFSNGRRSRRRHLTLGPLLHQAVIGLECSGLVIAKLELLPVELDIPLARLFTSLTLFSDKANIAECSADINPYHS